MPEAVEVVPEEPRTHPNSRLLEQDDNKQENDGLPPYAEDDTQNALAGNGRLPGYSLVDQTGNTTSDRRSRQQHSSGQAAYLNPSTVKKRKTKIRRRCMVALIVVTVLVGIAVGVAVGAKRRHRNDEDDFNVDELLKNATHKMSEQYIGKTFFDGFDFFRNGDNETYDSTLVDEETARQQGVIYDSGWNAAMQVQNSSTVRLFSKRSWSSGIFALEMYEIPRSCQITPSIRLSNTASASPQTALTLYQLQAQSFSSLGTKFEYWYSGYRSPRNDSCTASVRSDSGNGPILQCHNQNSTSAPANCGYSFDVRATSDYFILIVELNPQTKQMRLWNSMSNYKNSLSTKWIQQINASAIDITRPDWQKPDMVFTFDQECNFGDVFKDLKLVIDTSVCGDYGQFYWDVDDSRTFFTDGTWCENACGSTEMPESGWSHETKWDFQRITVFQPV